MFDKGFLPGFYHFFTLNLFDGISGNTNWVGLIGYIGAAIWIIYRISSHTSHGKSGGGGQTYYKVD